MTYYEILEISPYASEEVIRMAYKALAKKYHPDVYSGDKSFAEQQMKKINEAYEILCDFQKREEYDKSIKFTSKQASTHDTNSPPKTDTTTKSKEDASSPDISKKKIPLVLQWKVIILAFIISSISGIKILFYISVILSVLRIIIGFSCPDLKLHGLKKVAVTVFCISAILLNINTSDENSASNYGNNPTKETVGSVSINTTGNQDKETTLAKVVSGVTPYNKLNKYEIKSIHGIYDGKILINTSDSDEYMHLDIDSGRVIETFSGSISEGAFENGYISYYAKDNSEHVMKRIDGGKVVVPSDECRIEEILYEEEIFVISRIKRDYEYSCYELAAVSFNGEAVMDWIASPIDISLLCHNLGEGLVYLGDTQSFTDENGTSYFLNVYTGRIFEWSADVSLRDIVIWGSASLDGAASKFKDGYCVGYRQIGSSGFLDTTTEHFRFDFQTGYHTLFKINGGKTPVFERDNSVLYQYGYLGEWSETVKWSIYDMNGKEAFDTTNYDIKSFEAFNDCFGLIVGNTDGYLDSNFFTIVNLEGEELFSPINCTGMSVRQFNDEKIFCLIDAEKATFYNYNAENIGEIGIIIEEEKGLVFSHEKTYRPIDIEIIDGYVLGHYINEDENHRFFIGTLDYSLSIVPVEPSDADTQPQLSEPVADSVETISTEKASPNTDSSIAGVTPSGSIAAVEDSVSGTPRDTDIISDVIDSEYDLSVLWGKWILDDEWYVELKEGYYISTYQDGPMQIDDYYFDGNDLHVYFRVDPLDTGFVWSYYGVVSGDTMVLSTEIEDGYGYGAPELYYREGTIKPNYNVLEKVNEYGTELCGYDYYGKALYIGDVVRIGANSEGTQYAVGAIVGWDDDGTILVEFTNVFDVDEYGENDYYYIEGINDEIAQNGSTIQFVYPHEIQILFLE